MTTNNILTFVKKNIPIKLPKQHVSDTSKTLLGGIVNQMELAVNSWKLNQTYRERILSPDEFPKGGDFDHIVEDVKKEILSYKHHLGKQYSFVIGSRTFTIYAIYPYPYKNSTLDSAIKKMYVWLFVANHFAEPECSPNLTIYWYLTKRNKRLPREHTIIDRHHVNTAFTMACPLHDNSIYIFREEEWFKVLIHESFHSLGLDFAKMPETLTNEAVFSIFPVKCDLIFAEAYTECWAEIINVLFISVGEYTCKDTSIYIHKLSRSIENKMENERLFSLFQMSKVIAHNKMKYVDMFKANSYKEGSNVFSYYILKSIMIFFYNDFIEWSAVNNRGTVAFKKTQENILSLVKFIKDKHNNPEFMRIVDVFENAMSKLPPKHMVMETMRMSISE